MQQECIPVGCIPPTAVAIMGGSPHPPQAGTPQSRHPPDQIPLKFPLGCGPGPGPPQVPPWVWPGPDPPQLPSWVWPGPDPPQLPSWVWAWTKSPSTSLLGVGLDQIPLNSPLGCGPGPDPPQVPPWVWAWRPSPWPENSLIFPLGCEPGTLKGMLGYHPPRPAMHAGIPPAMHAGIPPPPPPPTPHGQNDRQV